MEAHFPRLPGFAGNILGSSREPPVYPEGFRWLNTNRTSSLQSGSPPDGARARRLQVRQSQPYHSQRTSISSCSPYFFWNFKGRFLILLVTADTGRGSGADSGCDAVRPKKKRSKQKTCQFRHSPFVIEKRIKWSYENKDHFGLSTIDRGIDSPLRVEESAAATLVGLL